MKTLGIGVRYNSHTKKYEARLGAKHLGFHRTLEEAAKAYNTDARKVFSFPIINQNEIIIIEEKKDIKIIEEPMKKVEEEKIEPKTKVYEEDSILSLEESLVLLKE